MSVRSISTSGQDEGPHEVDPIGVLEHDVIRLTYAIKDAHGDAKRVKELKKELKQVKKELAIEQKKVGGYRRRRYTRKHRKMTRKTLRRRRL